MFGGFVNILVPIFLTIGALVSINLKGANSPKTSTKSVKGKVWTYKITKNSMTDAFEINCSNSKSKYVSAGEDSLIIDCHTRGGVSGVQLRFDDEPALPMRLALPKEESIGVVWVENSDFEKALKSKRLRVSVLPVIGMTISEDISLDGLAETIQSAKNAVLKKGNK
jgi:hypothetical protein